MWSETFWCIKNALELYPEELKEEDGEADGEADGDAGGGDSMDAVGRGFDRLRARNTTEERRMEAIKHQHTSKAMSGRCFFMWAPPFYPNIP